MTGDLVSLWSWCLAWQDGHMGSHKHLIRQVGQPVERNRIDRRRAEWRFRAAALHKECVGDEFGVSFPFQAKEAEVLREVVHPDLRRRDTIAIAEPDKAGVIVRRALLSAVDGQIRDPLG